MLDARLAGLVGDVASSRLVAGRNLPLRIVRQAGQDAHLMPFRRQSLCQSGGIRCYAGRLGRIVQAEDQHA